MTGFSVSVRCTREEYMDFCAKRRQSHPLTVIVGAVLLVGAGVSYIVQQQMTQTGLLLLLLGLIGMTLDGLWLPMFRKGEAARRYDASDSLRQAVTVILEDGVINVKTAAKEGSLPLSLLTAVEETDAMIALVFGNECTVYIPKRVLREDENTALRDALQRKE